MLEARDRTTGVRVALKLLKGRRGSEHEARLRREARALAAAEHPHLVRFLAVHAGTDPPALAMELIEGESLAARLGRAGPLSLRECAALGAALGPALAMLHGKGFVHRDLKPGNVLLAPGRGPVLVDLGLAGGAVETRITATGAIVGTPVYAAPEVLRGQPAGPASDVFGLGVVLFLAATGELPYPPERMVATALGHPLDPAPRDRLAALFCEAAGQALAEDPGARPGATELGAALAVVRPGSRPSGKARAAATAPRADPPRTPPAPGLPGPGRARLAASLASLALIALALRPAPPPAPAPGPAAAPGTLPIPPRLLERQRFLEAAAAELAPAHPAVDRLFTFAIHDIERFHQPEPGHPSPPGQVVEPAPRERWTRFIEALATWIRGVASWREGGGPAAFEDPRLAGVVDVHLHGLAGHVLEDFYTYQDERMFADARVLQTQEFGLDRLRASQAHLRNAAAFKAGTEPLLAALRAVEPLPDDLAAFATLAAAILEPNAPATAAASADLLARLRVRGPSRTAYRLARAEFYLHAVCWSAAAIGIEARRLEVGELVDHLLAQPGWDPPADRIDLLLRGLETEVAISRRALPEGMHQDPDLDLWERLVSTLEIAGPARADRTRAAAALAIRLLEQLDLAGISAPAPPALDPFKPRLHALAAGP